MTDDNYKNMRQEISLNASKSETYTDKKQARIELRALKDALPLNIISDTTPREDLPVGVKLKRIAAYCIAEKINLKDLSKNLYEEEKINKSAMYFGECLYNSVTIDETTEETADIFFFDYGVIVSWGFQENFEANILKNITPFLEGKYDIHAFEIENFSYGIVSGKSKVINDVFYLNNEYYFNKMVISNAIAQSVKLDYFENIVDDTIDSVRDLPEDVENEGRVSKDRKGVFKLVGRLQRLKFNLNLISNILDEPEILWHHPEHQNLYHSFNHYLEIKPRVAVLNMRCDVIHNILQILSENIKTRNAEAIEKYKIGMIGFLILISLVQLAVLIKNTK